jgi:hypothetical protein
MRMPSKRMRMQARSAREDEDGTCAFNYNIPPPRTPSPHQTTQLPTYTRAAWLQKPIMQAKLPKEYPILA